MSRRLPILAVTLLLSAVPLLAQRGGAHASAGARGGMAAHSGFSGRAAGRSNGFRGTSGFGTHSSMRGSSFRQRNGSNQLNHFRGPRFRTYGFRNNCYGYSCRGRFGYPWWYAGAFDPYWWWDSSSYDDDQQRQIASANEMDSQSREQQMQREQNDLDFYARSSPPSARADQGQSQRNVPVPPTVLVFRDQSKREVQNYAIVGLTLWIFAPQRPEKIPLSDLDLSATAQANEDRGIEFRIPAAQPGQ